MFKRRNYADNQVQEMHPSDAAFVDPMAADAQMETLVKSLEEAPLAQAAREPECILESDMQAVEERMIALHAKILALTNSIDILGNELRQCQVSLVAYQLAHSTMREETRKGPLAQDGPGEQTSVVIEDVEDDSSDVN